MASLVSTVACAYTRDGTPPPKRHTASGRFLSPAPLAVFSTPLMDPIVPSLLEELCVNCHEEGASDNSVLDEGPYLTISSKAPSPCLSHPNDD